MGTSAPQSPSDTSTPNPGTPNVSDDDLDQMGVDRSARGFVDGIIAIASGLGMIGRWLGRGFIATIKFIGMLIGIVVLSTLYLAVTGWDWVRADKKNAGLAGLATALVIAVGFIAFGNHGSTPPSDPPRPPITTEANGNRLYKAKSGDHLASIGAQFGVNRLDMEVANLELIRQNTADCIEKKPTAYLAGLLKDGKTPRDGSYCELSNFKGEPLALDTLKVGQTVTIPVPKVAANSTR